MEGSEEKKNFDASN